MANLSYLTIGIPASGRLVFRNIHDQVIPPPPTTGTGGEIRRRHYPAPQAPPALIIRGSMLVQEAADGFFATGDVYESQAQIDVRRRARALRIILMSS